MYSVGGDVRPNVKVIEVLSLAAGSRVNLTLVREADDANPGSAVVTLSCCKAVDVMRVGVPSPYNRMDEGPPEELRPV